MNDLLTDHWRTTRTSLAYRLTIFTLWYWRFDAFAYDRHFTELNAGESLPELPKSDKHFYIYPSYPIVQPPPALRRDHNRLIYTPKTFPNYFVDLTLEGGFEKYIRNFSSKTRSTLRRKVRKLSELSPNGTLDFRTYRSPTELVNFLNTAAGISEKTYQTRLLDCGLPTKPEFRQQVLELANQGAAYGFLLFIEERPVAFVYAQRRNGVVSYDYVGHDPEFNALSPGTVLQYCLLEYLFSDARARIFDFTEGEGPHKALFATGRTLCAKSFLLPRRPSTVLLVHCHILLGKLNHFIDVLAERLMLRQKIRRLIRRSPAEPEREQ